MKMFNTQTPLRSCAAAYLFIFKIGKTMFCELALLKRDADNS